MNYFDDPKHVEHYTQMVEGSDGRELIAVLSKHLAEGSTVLELGMGPGKDLDLLSQTYTVTGSDSSNVFLQRYRQTHPTADLLLLDAVTLQTKRTFDCLYSNKVLHHLHKADLAGSWARQRELLTPGGLLMHSFWYGKKEEEHHGLRFVYYTETALLKAIGPGFQVVAMERYKELEEGDSFYIILQKVEALFESF